MVTYPTLHVENFAGIRQADIELAPLTLFVGNNNSGKTYLASLIWGMRDIVLEIVEGYKFTQGLQNLLAQINDILRKPKYNESIEITQELHNEIIATINTLLENNDSVEEWTKKIFRIRVPLGRVSFSVPFQNKTRFSLDKIEKTFNNESCLICRFGILRHEEKFPSFVNLNINDDLTAEKLLSGLIKLYLGSYWDISSFFPNTRNGILLTFLRFVKELIKDDLSASEEYRGKKDSQFTAPQAHFIEQLVYSPNKSNGKQTEESSDKNIADIVDFIEREMIRGRVVLSDTPLPSLMYQQKDSNEVFPMNLSSGVVTAVAPILAALKYRDVGERCIIDEPEMSLHPALEARMAQVLVRLANSIDFVLALTQSDTITQHINNMIKLSNRTDGEELRRKYGYEEKDIISSDRVRMYQFDVADDGMTDVTQLEVSPNGFRLPTFANYLRELRDQTWEMQINDNEILKEH